MARGDPQINIRLESSRYAALEAAAFLSGTSVQGLVREVIQAEADRHARHPRVTALLRERADYQAEQAGNLRSLAGTEATRRVSEAE
jgi:uncharacterized protein (DUF1778 family)